MKSYYLCLMAIVTLLSFSSCSEENSTENDVRKEVKVTATFSGLSASGIVTTRAVDDGWEVGDAIGLFMKKAGTTLEYPVLADNVKYTTDRSLAFENLSENKVYYPFDKSNVDFIAYYPYRSNLNEFIYKVDVSDQSNLANIDLMYSNNVKAKNYTTDSINLDFKHQLTKVVLKIAENNSDNTTGDFTAKIKNARKNANFSLVDGKLTVGDELADISFNVDNATLTAEAILLPDTDLTDKEFVITIGDISYSYSLNKSTEITSFQASTKCEYNITIEPNDNRILNNVTAKITDWATVTDSIVADEVPSNADNGNTEPEGEVTPPVPGDGEGGEPTEPEGGDDPVLPTEGDGTQENPYTIAQAINLEPLSKVWIKGYIVGWLESFEKLKTETGLKASIGNFALSDFPDSVSIETFLPVDLSGSAGGSEMQNKLNLKHSPDNLGREVLLECNIEEWIAFGGQTRISGKKIQAYSFVDE